MDVPIEHTTDLKVRTFDIGATGKLQMHSLMQYLQEAASVHANRIGVGFDWMRTKGLYWVLVNLRIEFERVPFYGEGIRIRTYPSGFDLMKAFREFVGETSEGEPLFKASSEWMVLKRGTGRLIEMAELQFEFPFSGQRTLGDLQRLRPIQGYSEVSKMTIPFSAIDMNGHVNNCEYVRWGMDALRKFEPQWSGNTRSLQISFNAELRENEYLDIFAARGAGGLTSLKGAKVSDSKTAFLMEVL